MLIKPQQNNNKRNSKSPVADNEYILNKLKERHLWQVLLIE